MRVAYFDCFGGASGDMILAALVDAGASVEMLRDHLRLLPVRFDLSADRVLRHGLSATQVTVAQADAGQPHRHLSHILELIRSARLTRRVQSEAEQVFCRLAEAEAFVHGSSADQVHFHEVGAVDALVDVVGACIGLELLGVDRVICSPIPAGSGTVSCQHGVLPVPAPAVCWLLRGVPLAASPEPGELTTPTGAAILTTLSSGYGSVPAMTLHGVGCGAGRREGQTRANILRVLLGETTGPTDFEDLVLLQAAIDDQTPQVTAFAVDRLLASGALDAYCQPIQMKKNRPGVLLTVLCRPQVVDEVEGCLYAQTTTFGVRHQQVRRTSLDRCLEEVQLPAGTVRIKVGSRRGQVVSATPEFEDCRRIAEATSVPLKQIMADAVAAWRRRLQEG